VSTVRYHNTSSIQEAIWNEAKFVHRGAGMYIRTSVDKLSLVPVEPLPHVTADVRKKGQAASESI
jgi:hypothetical protein